ncbi:MAG: hypothetical protein AB8H47_09210 [Bacteroidia bacterium]
MASNQRPYFTVKTQASTSLRFKYAIGIGVLASLALAVVMVSLYEPNLQTAEVKKVSVVKITPINTSNLSADVDMSARKDIAEVVQLQKALSYDKSGVGLEKKQLLAEQVTLLRALEDVQLKIALHVDDPTFDHHLWNAKQQAIEKRLTPSTH